MAYTKQISDTLIQCTKCLLVLDICNFYKRSDYGYRHDCKQCSKKKRDLPENKEKTKTQEYKDAKNLVGRNFYKNNKEKVKKKVDKYRASNPEKVKKSLLEYRSTHKEDMHIYYMNNKDVFAEKRIIYIQENPEKIKEGRQKYAKENPGKVRASGARQRALRFQAMPKWLTEEHDNQIISIYTKSQEVDIKCEVDHIIPINNKLVCGLHVPWNLQILTKSENRYKTNKFDGTYDNESWKIKYNKGQHNE